MPAAELRARLNAATTPPATVAEATEAWLVDYQQRRQTRHAVNLRSGTRRWVSFAGGLSMNDLGYDLMTMYRDQLAIRSGLSRGQCNTSVKYVKQAAAWWRERRWIDDTTMTAMRSAPGLEEGAGKTYETEPVVPPTDATLQLYREAMAEEAMAATNILQAVRIRRYTALLEIEFDALTSMRIGEAVNLNTDEIETHGDLLVFTPGKHKTRHHGVTRQVTIGPMGRQALQGIDCLRQSCWYFESHWRGQWRGEPIKPNGARSWIVRFGERNNLPHLRWSQGRHYGNTKLAELEGEETAMQQSDHTTAAMNRNYTRTADPTQRKRGAADAMRRRG